MNRKKIAAGFISFALMMQSCVFAVSAAEENKTANFEYDDFSVSYSVTNSYGNTEVVSLTLTNTGDETIEDWMLYFEPNGNIQYVTNATEMTAENGKMYFKNNGYNADIAPSSAVTFTYAVNDCTEIPDYYALCQTRVEKTEGYDVSLSVGESWGDSFNGSIVITNHTDKPIEAWELSIDTNFTITEISNSWAATVTELDEYQYLLKGTYTSTIAANSSVSLGFIGVKSGEPEISSYSLTEVKEDTSKMGSSTSIENIKLSASTKDLLTTDDGKVYFYAKPAYDDVHEINLVDASNGIVLATMYDDGDYENHGDDLENDGVFSCVVTVDNAVEAQLSFYAEDGANKSSDFIIDVYEDISDESIDEMIAVNNALETFSESDEYKNLTFEERVDAIKNLLKQLSETGTEEYCSLPRKTQKTDTQNEKNAPEHHVQERFLLPINGISPLFLPVQFLVNTGNMLQDLPQHISVLPSVQSVLPSVRRRSSCCIFRKSIQPSSLDNRRIIPIRIVQIHIANNAGNASLPTVLPQPVIPGIIGLGHPNMREKHVIPFFYVIPDTAFQSRLERIDRRIVTCLFQHSTKRLTKCICILQAFFFLNVKCNWILELFSSQSRQAHSSLLLRFCGSFGITVPVCPDRDSKPLALAVVPCKLHIDLAGFFSETSP